MLGKHESGTSSTTGEAAEASFKFKPREQCGVILSDVMQNGGSACISLGPMKLYLHDAGTMELLWKGKDGSVT